MFNQKKKDKFSEDQSQVQRTVSFITVDKNIRFLNTFMSADKAFQILCTVCITDSEELALNHSQV